EVPQLQTIADRIVRSTNSAKKIREIITDPQRSELVTITIPEAMGVLEMEDLLSAVVRLGISCHHLIINMISPPTECGFCTAKRREQLKYVRQVKKKAKPRGYLVTELELFPREIKGLDALTNLGQRLGGNGRRL
ncbi:MAG: ArsA-related P-loop ATPase, partial [Dehalococcoidia bacterium]